MIVANDRTQDYWKDDNDGHVTPERKTMGVRSLIQIWDANWELM